MLSITNCGHISSQGQQVITSCAEFPVEYSFDITNCDVKDERRTTHTSLRLHRTRRRHAVQRAPLATRGGGQYRHHVHVCAVAPPDGLSPAGATQGVQHAANGFAGISAFPEEHMGLPAPGLRLWKSRQRGQRR